VTCFTNGDNKTINSDYFVQDRVSGELEKRARALNMPEKEVQLPSPADFVRLYSFRKTLRAYEMDNLGLEDCGHVYYGNGLSIPERISQGQVWKDSIAADHGEYTHRLQWLAIHYFLTEKVGFKKDQFKSFYQSTIRAGTAKMRNNSEEQEAHLWDFLVDCFDVGAKNIGQRDQVQAVKEYMLSDSFRSPNVTTGILQVCPQTPFIRSYLVSTRAKLQLIAQVSQKTGLTTNIQQQGLNKYRREKMLARGITPLDGKDPKQDLVFIDPPK
jgi:hypothetical protein